jgi:DNA invertase Pin-like site-specific DNA recombinase
MRSKKGGIGPQPIQAVLYVRVSSKEQEKEGFSIAAQLRLLREYAARLGFVIVKEFVDVETARRSGRTHFNEMVAYLKRHHEMCRTILVEKTDRLYRNPKDWVLLDELDVDIHLVKENEIASPNSRSSEKFMHGMRVLMAKNFIDNLSEETKKGMLEKARSGVYPSYARVGYRNTDGPNGKRVISPDPEAAPTIADLYTRFATGQYSVEALVAELRAEGVTLRGRRIFNSLVHQILRNRLYMGDFDWDGVTYEGTHEPLVSRDCWERVQELLDKRAETKTRKVKHDFAFSGLVQCGHCGCLLVGELKKHRYVYYHCTGNRGKCPEPYTRQEVLTHEFLNVLRELVIPQPVLDWLGDAVVESDRTERAARERTVKRFWTDHQRLSARIETMYLDKLDGRITQEFFDQCSAGWCREQDAIIGKINRIRSSAPAPVEAAVDALSLTSRACELFEQQTSSEQRRLLQLLIREAAWKEGKLWTTLFEPFEVLRHSNQESSRKERELSGAGRKSKIWLAD